MSKLIQFAKQHKLTVYKGKNEGFYVDMPLGHHIDGDLHTLVCFKEQEIYDEVGDGSTIEPCTDSSCELCIDRTQMTPEEYAEWMEWELIYSPNPTKSDYEN